ncbi:PAS domain S-box protein [Phormidesmis priestleyi ULC007]|uniref:PAS domain S-box protein n=1 Tax=Phormidesmis priestleyi ULC007 TaxID=1920490 RepID=A0A2T1DKE9_9CYAN|nr:histidine kinase dimerization/phosphoacceptor domain -containing protein [Phormidesmis priestleyi]PSB20931.1 PAS domain S-box protein [Phormidesmis priestleyi ULC007]PZO51886.1 MAG: PAS domain S-box protein [Phormidesmis priestleyi]
MEWNELAQHIGDIQTQFQQLQQTIALLPQTDTQATHLNYLFENLLSGLQKIDGLEMPLQGEQTLRASEEKWRALSACSPVGIFTCDVDGRITYTNPRCHEIGDFTLEASLGQEFATVIHAEDRDRVVSQWCAQAPTGQPHADEFRLVNPEGAVRWVRVRTAPIVSNDGNLMGHTGTLEDITKQKQAEAQIKASLREKEALLKEIHHRVKNNLQIISSLLYLQAQRIEDPKVRQIFEDSQSRISAMALVHDNLYRSQSLARINFSEYIQTLTTSLFYTYRIQPDLVQLKMDVDDNVLVSLDKAIPCGLVLNELMTNALKHGFSDGTTGEIAVTLKKVSSGQIYLTVENDGNNLPETFELKTIQSMGLRLVHGLVNQLQGHFELDKTDKTCFTITFSDL